MSLHENETKFHDDWALSESLDSVQVLLAFEAPTAMENRFILQQMGDISSKKILDVGAGLGEASVYFALKGAAVTSLDISPQMSELTKKLAQKYRVEVRALVGQAENSLLGESEFDFIYVGNLVHHVEDKETLFRGLNRVLKPGGTIFFWDPLKYNPIIEIYRRIAVSVRSEGESPLGRADLFLMEKHFSGLQTRMFWLVSLLLFIKYFAIDRISPNKVRYWKHIFLETESSLRWWYPLRTLDEFLLRIPAMRWLAWNVVAWGHKKE